MTRRLTRFGRRWLALVFVAVAPAVAAAQGVSLDVSAGRLVYDPVAASVGTSNVLGTLRFDGRSGGWVYGAAAAPVAAQDTLWTAGGAGGRFLQRSATQRVRVGIDTGAHVFSFRDRLADRAGSGATFDALPFLQVAAGAGIVELGGGWRAQTLAVSGVRESRGVLDAGARASYGTRLRVDGQARLVNAAEGAFPFVGASLVYDDARGQAWIQTGKWLSTTLDDRTWAIGGSLTLGPRAALWASVRQEAPDPLYWNPARRTWNVGVTRRLGRVMRSLDVVPAHSSDSAIVLRVRAADAPAGDVFVGGDFNNWQPVLMQHEGNEWVLRLPLQSGVYHYAFRSASGKWFVPASTPGRRDDGMGGDVAVLIVG